MRVPEKGLVYVNNKPRRFFPGITVRIAIGPEKAEEVMGGALTVRDEFGHLIGLDGSLAEGERIFVMPARKSGKE
jgi:hypothetical protein